MTLIAVSTIVRRAAPDEQSSYLRLVDLERNEVVATVATPESPRRTIDTNVRGGHRGTRGVSGFRDRFVVAISDRLFVLDPDWKLVKEISHPWVGMIHDVLATADGVWVTSTAACLLTKFDWDGELVQHWHWASDPELPYARGFRTPPAFDESIDYRVPAYGLGIHDAVHINAVVARDTNLLVNLGQVRSPSIQRWQRARAFGTRTGAALPAVRQAIDLLRTRQVRRGERRAAPAPLKAGASHAIVELELSDGRPGPARIVWHRRGTTRPNHNIGHAMGLLLFNDSLTGIAGADLETGKVEFTIPIPGSPTFARGLCLLDGEECLVGSQRPAAIYRVSLRDRAVTEAIELGGEPWETVYGICTVPDEFSGDSLVGFAAWASGLEPAPK